jgi:vancomycin resistance protein VanJ
LAVRLARATLILAAYAYFVPLAGWMLLHALFPDRWPWLFAITSFAAYLFVPLPLMAAVAALTRRLDLAAWVLLGAAAWAYLFGVQFVPGRATPVAEASGPVLRVMTYNILGYNTNTEAVLRVLREADADLVALQEVNPENAAAIERELADRYPYRLLDQRPGVTGSGLLSRYPLTLLGDLPGPWLGRAHVVHLDFNGQLVNVIRFHAYSGISRLQRREEAAQALADYAAAHPGPLIALGDLNATSTHEAYQVITAELRDAWREAGWGLGHTFPGALSPGSSRPVIMGVPVPKWLIRIDYVFHSGHFRALSARIGPWDETSDHRPVVADLELIDPARP